MHDDAHAHEGQGRRGLGGSGWTANKRSRRKSTHARASQRTGRRASKFTTQTFASCAPAGGGGRICGGSAAFSLRRKVSWLLSGALQPLPVHDGHELAWRQHWIVLLTCRRHSGTIRRECGFLSRLFSSSFWRLTGQSRSKLTAPKARASQRARNVQHTTQLERFEICIGVMKREVEKH